MRMSFINYVFNWELFTVLYTIIMVLTVILTWRLEKIFKVCVICNQEIKEGTNGRMGNK